jgi:endonuclease I
LTGNDLIEYLENNYSVTNAQSYNSARDAMFNTLDEENGQISCVYTGYTISFTDRQDAQSKGFNTEHTWPQSFYDQDSPMRTDIHHLYPTRSDVNSARSNYDFAEIPDSDTDRWYRNSTNTTSMPTSNIDEYSELETTASQNTFEPREDHKGNVARAVFYFWSVYQNNSSVTSDGTDNEAFFNRMKDDLLAWHDADPVDQKEVDRSIGIEAVQGNRNPFVHDTTLVRRAFFGGMPVSNEVEPNDVELSFKLHQNYPNPFNPSTKIGFELAEAGQVTINVYSTIGKNVAQVVNSNYSAGSHSISFDASSLPGGVYFYAIRVNGATQVKQMTLIK